MPPPLTNTGVITGFHEIDLSPGSTREYLTPTHFSLADARKRIEEIRRNFDPDFLDALVVQVLSHVQNFSNPHHVTLAQVDVNIMQLVYDTWLAMGNTGTMTEFEEVLFQSTPVASLADIEGGVSTNLVPVSGVTSMIAAHNVDPDAHADLLALILPGTPPLAMPSFALDARMGLPLNATVTCSTSLLLINRAGNLVTVPPNTVGIDYSTGHALFPLYGARNNTLFPSNPLSHPGTLLGGTTMTTATSIAPVGTLTNGPDQNSCAVLNESNVTETHGYSVPVTMTAYLEYTSTVFVYPLNTADNVVLYLDSQPQIAILVDLANNTVTTPSGAVIGYVQPLANGWLRLGMQYIAPASITANLIIAQTQQTAFGSGWGYLGTGQPMFGLFGLQHVQGAGMSPYIPTTTSSASHGVTVMTIATTLYNLTNGMLAFCGDQPNSLLPIARNLVQFGTSLTITNTAGQITAVTTNNAGGTDTLALPAVYNEKATAVFSYAPSEYELGSTGSAKIATTGASLALPTASITITLGSSGNPFNGGLQLLSLYPTSDTEQQIEFLIGEVI